MATRVAAHAAVSGSDPSHLTRPLASPLTPESPVSSERLSPVLHPAAAAAAAATAAEVVVVPAAMSSLRRSVPMGGTGSRKVRQWKAMLKGTRRVQKARPQAAT